MMLCEADKMLLLHLRVILLALEAVSRLKTNLNKNSNLSINVGSLI